MVAASQSRRAQAIWIAAAAALGISLRLASATLGHNDDLESFDIAGRIVAAGQTVYSHTYRYSYGPIWAYLLGALKQLQLHFGLQGPEAYHLLITGLLSVVDLLTACALWRRWGWVPAVLLLLNPVSILITGYHGQFDVLALYVGLWSWIVLDRPGQNGASGDAPLVEVSWRDLVISGGLLGLSLSIKHFLIFLPLWLCFYPRVRTWSKRAAYCAISYGLFFGAFLPFWFDAGSREGIIENVFKNRSYPGDAFFPRILELFVHGPMVERRLDIIPIFGGSKILWATLMVVLAYWVNRHRPRDAFWIYLVSLLVLAPALSVQQFVIPLVVCAVWWKEWPLQIYWVLASVLLLGHEHNLGGVQNLDRYTHWARALELNLYHPITWLAVFLGLYIARARREPQMIPARSSVPAPPSAYGHPGAISNGERRAAFRTRRARPRTEQACVLIDRHW